MAKYGDFCNKNGETIAFWTAKTGFLQERG